MTPWLSGKWDELRTSFWFVPTLMVASAILLSLAMIAVDRALPDRDGIAALGWEFTRGPEGSRALLSVAAGSMMTIASVTFSITIVALQLASSQFGPRLLRNFMRDRVNQVAIGTFIATFTYCLMVLRAVNGTDAGQFVPHLAVTVGLELTLASLGVLIFFIHHAAESIQAESVIAAVSRELHNAIDRAYPDRLEEGPPESSVAPSLPDAFDRDARPVVASRSDYLQTVDVDGLLSIATEKDLVLALKRRPGDFCFRGSELARAWPGDRVTDDTADAIRCDFLLGPRRTLTQDIEFAIDQLVEVAVRALSPGVNDPFTAMACVDRLGAALCVLAEKSLPSPYRHDEAGRLRVVTDATTIPGLVDASFHQVRQASRGNASVTIRLLETIAAVAKHARDPVFRTALRRHADAVHRGGQEAIADVMDRADADRRHREVMAILDGPSQAGPAEKDRS